MKEQPTFNCPICKAELKTQPGTQLNPANGVTLYCDNLECKDADGFACQEVAGHADTVSHAFDIIKDKYHAN